VEQLELVELPRPVARGGDPHTSWEAARSLPPQRLRRSLRVVLAALVSHPGGLTDEQLRTVVDATGYAISDSGLRTRRHELADLGYVQDSGRRLLTLAGRHTIVWVATGKTEPTGGGPDARHNR